MKRFRGALIFKAHRLIGSPIAEAAGVAEAAVQESGLCWLDLISHKVFMKPFCRSQLPHKSVNLSFTITNIKNKLTDFCMTAGVAEATLQEGGLCWLDRRASGVGRRTQERGALSYMKRDSN